MRDEGWNPSFATTQIQSGIGKIAQDRTGRRILASPAPVKQRIAHYVTSNENRIEHAVDTGEHVLVRHQRRVNAHLHALSRLFDDAQQFDRVSQLPGKMDIRRGNGAYALDVD